MRGERTSLRHRRLGITKRSARALGLGAVLLAALVSSSVYAPQGTAVTSPNCNVTQARSVVGETPSTIEFINESGTTVDIFWLDYEGDRVIYRTLAPEERYVQGTWLTHPWVAIDQRGSCLGYTLSSQASQTYRIQPLVEPEPDTSGETSIASLSNDGIQLGAPSTFPSISDDGSLVGFESNASGVTPFGNLYGALQAYVRSSLGTTLVSIAMPPFEGPRTGGNANSGYVQVSGDGGEVAFQSLANNLACTNVCLTSPGGAWHVYRRNLDAGTTEFVDARGNTIANGSSQHPAISRDGGMVAFDTVADNLQLEPADTNGASDIYLRDLGTGLIERVSVANGSGEQANGASFYPAISATGRYVAFVSEASNLVDGDTNDVADVFVRDRETGSTIRVSVATDESESSSPSSEGIAPSISADGTRIAFQSNSNSLAPNIPVESGSHVFVRDLTAGTTTMADLGTTDAPGNAQASAPSISDDGAIVSFTSTASNLTPLVPDFSTHVYVRDLEAATTRVVDLTPAGIPGGGSSQNGLQTALSDDGRFAAFYSAASDLLGPGKDGNETLDVFVRDLRPQPLATGATATLTAGAASTEAGAKQLPIDNFPLSILRPPATAVAPAPIDNFPIDNFPIDNFPIDNFPIDNFPIDNFPIDNFPFDAPTVARELADVPLSSIGITYPGGWPKVLEGSQYAGVPPQGVSLQQLALANPKSPALDPASPAPKLTFDQLDFSSSKLRRLGFEALAAGATPLSQLNPAGGGDALTDWCTALSGPPISCTTANVATTVGSQTVLGAALTGAPIDNFPIDNMPIDNMPIDNMPIDNMPIDNMPLSVSPIDNFPIDNFDLAASGFGGLPLRQVLSATLPSPSGGAPQTSPLRAIPVASLQAPAAVLTETTDATLGAALAAGHVRQTATLGDLAGSLGGFTLGDIYFYGDPALTVHDLILGLPTPTGVSFSDLLALFITRSGIAWETLSTDTLAQFGTNGGLEWRAAFSLVGPEGADGAATVAATLPAGWRFDPAVDVQLLYGETTATLPDPAISAGGRTLTWTVDGVEFNSDYQIDFTAVPGVQLGPTSASLRVTATGTEIEAVDSEDVTVRTVFEPNDNPATAPIVTPNVELDLSYIDSRTDLDYLRIPAPPAGWRLQVHMTNLPADYDLTLYAPPSAPLVSTGQQGVPLQDPPIPDDGLGMTDTGAQLQPGGLQDIPTANLPIAGQSIFRGTDPEDVAAISPGGSGYFVLQVSGYSGATSPLPYTLRITSAPPRALGNCPPRSFPFPTQGVAGTPPLSIPANVNTIFLVNRLRLGRSYGATEATNVINALTSLAGQASLGVSGVVIPVEAYGDNAANYAAWDADPCSPERANTVASGIAATVNSIRASAPGLRYVVFVGGDDQVPHFRIPDLTMIANQRSEASTFSANQYYGAFQRENLLSDDPYLDTDPVQAGTRQVFVPDLAGGRLVETPAQIVDQISEYVSFSGQLLRQTAFSSGYDFASDGTRAAANELSGIVGTANTRDLINDTWDRAAFLNQLFPTTGASSINQLNGHYDHYQALPAAGNTTGDTSDLVTTADVDARANALRRRIVFSIGCHAGLAVSNVVVGETSPIRRDWAEAYASQKAAYAANTGYGLGSTDSVAYSEELMALFAKHLDGSLSIGQAFAEAKADYFLGRANFSAYEQKTTLVATLYGLPFFGVGNAPAAVGAPPPAPPAPGPIPGAPGATTPAGGPIVIDPISQLRSAEFSVAPVFTRETGSFGEFWSNAGRVTASHYRPLVSTLALPATRPGERAHSAFIESLTSLDDSPWDASFRMPTEDLTRLSPEPNFTDVGFPSAIPAMATTKTVSGLRSQLNLATSQYFTDDTPGRDGAAVMRRWTAIGGRVFYNSSTDYVPPTITSSEATRFGSNVGFAVSACEALRVHVLYDDLGETAAQDVWRPLDLVQDAPGSCRWTGGATIIGPNVQYIVQACDSDGNCAMSTNKAHYFQAQPTPPPSGAITITLTGQQVVGKPDYFSDAVSVAVSPAAGAAVTIDGAVPASLPATVSSDGLHEVVVVTPAGDRAERMFVIDRTAPRIVIATPATDAVYTIGDVVRADFTCLDSGSGIASCVGSTADGAPLPTASIGEKTLTVTGTDLAGRTTTASRTYRVIWPFTGFFSPIDNPPSLNLANAGRAIPIKFGLGGDRGLAILAPGSPSSGTIPCAAGAPIDPVEETLANGSGLTYEAASNRYQYVWKTSSAWAGTCRQLVLTLADGTVHRANFKFK